MDISLSDVLGYVAGGLVILAFCMSSLVPLWVFAILSNIAFIGFALTKDLTLVLLLHGALLPVSTFGLGHAILASRHKRSS